MGLADLQVGEDRRDVPGQQGNRVGLTASGLSARP
jgi:hypothetical protein